MTTQMIIRIDSEFKTRRCCKVEVNCGDGSSFDFAQDEVIFIAFRIRHILP